MPHLAITAQDGACTLHNSAAPLLPALRRALGQDGPVIVMIHGYKYAPGHARSCPHRLLLSARHPSRGARRCSLPRGLGFGGGPDEGLGIGFGWPARGSIWQAWSEAGRAGAALAGLLDQIAALAPGRKVQIIAHSLGVRVALAGLRQARRAKVGRVVMLAGAEYTASAREAALSPAGRGAEFINITSRENDLFDFLVERLLRPPMPGDRCLGLGLAGPRRPDNWLDLQLDCPGTLQGLSALGHAIAPPRARVCHWPYMRPGMLDFYAALLRAPARTPLAALRAARPGAPAPRWSRLLAPPRAGFRLPIARGAAS